MGTARTSPGGLAAPRGAGLAAEGVKTGQDSLPLGDGAGGAGPGIPARAARSPLRPDPLGAATATLREAGIEAPRREARWLMEHAGGDRRLFESLLARRAAREPLAFVLGRQGFWTLDLEVSPATLIPRPDSETLIEAALAAFPDRGAVRRILDLGTGTGCLLLAALSEFPEAFGIGVDLVPAAAALAARNARSCGLAGRCAIACGDWAAALSGKFELVLANPPYILSAEIDGLMPEVARHEPATALDGGHDGLDAYRAVFDSLRGVLAPHGVAVIEFGLGQAAEVTALARERGFPEPSLREDLAGIARVAVLRRAGG